MNQYTKDILFLIAIEFDDIDLANFCKTNKYFNEKICKSDTIWNYKLSQLSKKYSEDIENLRNEVNNSRELYQLIKSLIVAKDVFKLDGNLTKLYNRGSINVSNKEITNIPNLSLFKNLKTLSLSDNKIEKIPETLPDSLEELWLYNNKIEKIPDKLPNSLKTLDLTANKIKKVPDTLPTSLKELWLINDEIMIPEKYKNIVVLI
jgi:Leucine-rich repeat (LRR) protein